VSCRPGLCQPSSSVEQANLRDGMHSFRSQLTRLMLSTFRHPLCISPSPKRYFVNVSGGECASGSLQSLRLRRRTLTPLCLKQSVRRHELPHRRNGRSQCSPDETHTSFTPQLFLVLTMLKWTIRDFAIDACDWGNHVPLTNGSKHEMHMPRVDGRSACGRCMR
jgi:hypothetical protein